MHVLDDVGLSDGHSGAPLAGSPGRAFISLPEEVRRAVREEVGRDLGEPRLRTYCLLDNARRFGFDHFSLG